MKFKWPSKYACKIGHKLVQFTSNGTYVTDDKYVIDVLSNLSNISILDGKVEKKVSVTKEILEEAKKQEEEEKENIKELYKEKFGKKVPNNKKNDLEWIEKKLAE